MRINRGDCLATSKSDCLATSKNDCLATSKNDCLATSKHNNCLATSKHNDYLATGTQRLAISNEQLQINNNNIFYKDEIGDFFVECCCTDDLVMRYRKFDTQVVEVSELIGDDCICDKCKHQMWVILPDKHEYLMLLRLERELEATVIDYSFIPEECNAHTT